jgi:hypothetical protein
MHSEDFLRQLRSFGLVVGGIFGAIAIYPVLARSEDPRGWALVLSGALIIPAVLMPRVLGPAYRVWMAAGQVLGWINTRIILGILFYFVVTPLGLLQRMRRKSAIARKFDKTRPTYRVNRTTRAPSHVMRQF